MKLAIHCVSREQQEHITIDVWRINSMSKLKRFEGHQLSRTYLLPDKYEN